MAKKLIHFDWAMKKMLRHKANFDILEGFLSELLNRDVKIKQILDSEANKETGDDKFNRVDILVEFSDGELVIIEVQNSNEHDYFHRMLYGVAKAISEHIKEKQPYSEVKKVISITIAYFDLGQGKDYVYHGTTEFRGIHKNDLLALADKQIELYNKGRVHEIYPEFWVLKINKFDEKIKDRLDEWIYFLKTGEIKRGFSAKGLKEANEKLDSMKMSEKERQAYNFYLKQARDIASRNFTIEVDAKDLIKKAAEAAEKALAEGLAVGKAEGLAVGKAEGIAVGKAEADANAAIGFFEIGVSIENIAKALKMPIEKVEQVIETDKKH